MRVAATVVLGALLGLSTSASPINDMIPPILAGMTGSAADDDSFCPQAHGKYQWSQLEHGPFDGGKNKTDFWFMSPCTKATRPNGSSGATYLELVNSTEPYDVPTLFSVIEQQWTRVDAETFQANFSTGHASWAQVTATCDATVDKGTIMPNGRIYEDINHYDSAGGTWKIPVKINCGGFCPKVEGKYSWTQLEHGPFDGGENKTDTWFMSPCSKAAPSGSSDAVYLELVSSTEPYNVPVKFTHIANQWTKVSGASMDTYRANFTTGASSTFGPGDTWAQVTATCDASVPAGTIVPNGRIYENINKYHSCCGTWEIPVKINCGGFCPGAAGHYTWSQKEHGPLDNGSPTDTWFLSPCKKAVPQGKTTPVFMELLSSTEGYSTVRMTQFAKNWTQVRGQDNTWVANLTAEPGSAFEYTWVQVTATCDSSVAPGTVVPNGKAYENEDKFHQCCATWLVPIKVNCDGGNGPMTTTTVAPTTMAPPTPVPVPADCGQYKSCSDCTVSSTGTCGFCASTKQCLSGTSIGPNTGSCPDTQTNWKWFSSEC